MKLPRDTMIAREKLEDYLLRPRDDHDKAGFLALAGYDRDSVGMLDTDLRTQLLPLGAEIAGASVYGQKFVIRGTLTGPNGRSLRVLSVWMLDNASGLTKFITLHPEQS